MLTYFPEVNEQYDNKELTEKWNKILEPLDCIEEQLLPRRTEAIRFLQQVKEFI